MSIRLFDKTPAGVVCPHFWILSWARGCPYSCSYCYLALTHRFRGVTPHFYDWHRIKKALDKFFAEHKEQCILNTGELADSLINPKLMEKICDKFETQSTHKVLLLSKGVHSPLDIDFLCKKKYKQTTVSFSVNAHGFAEVYEKGSALSDNKLTFSVDSLLLSELGERLVTKNYIALAELIKNAYDADATQVMVIFKNARIAPSEKSEIRIIDNGHGMLFQQIRDFWMRIATPNKIRNPISPRFGRKKTGDKGIGRFACQRLAKKLIVESIAKKEGSHRLEYIPK